MSLYTHKKSGTEHILTGSGNNIRFVAAADFAAGDTFRVNGTGCTARTVGGDTLWAGFFRAGAVVVCYRTGNALTFNGGGLPAGEAKAGPRKYQDGCEHYRQRQDRDRQFYGGRKCGSGEHPRWKDRLRKGKESSGDHPVQRRD